MSLPPFFATLKAKRMDAPPKGREFVECGTMLYDHDSGACWIKVWAWPNPLPYVVNGQTCYASRMTCASPPSISQPPFIHGDIEVKVREYVDEAGDRKRVWATIGYIDTREAGKSGQAFYVVTLHVCPVVRDTKGYVYLRMKQE